MHALKVLHDEQLKKLADHREWVGRVLFMLTCNGTDLADYNRLYDMLNDDHERRRFECDEWWRSQTQGYRYGERVWLVTVDELVDCVVVRYHQGDWVLPDLRPDGWLVAPVGVCPIDGDYVLMVECGNLLYDYMDAQRVQELMKLKALEGK